MEIKFYNLDSDKDLKYSVIISKDSNGFVFVKHRDRNTWEIPGGHIEQNETSIEAAKRELKEEAGASVFSIKEVCDYSLTRDDSINFGRLFYAEIKDYSESLEHEIVEVGSFQVIPKELTYPQIQPYLFEEVLNRLNIKVVI